VRVDPYRSSYVGIDMALKNDSIGVVLVQLDPAGVAQVLPKVWAPTPGRNLDVAAVEGYLRELHRSYRVAEFVYDPAYFERSAQALADEGLPMVEHPQSRSRMVPACSLAFEQIAAGRVRHDGQPTLSKGRSRRKIDACIALVMALTRAHAGLHADYNILDSVR
jgi:phage terminase large subunit-like protein